MADGALPAWFLETGPLQTWEGLALAAAAVAGLLWAVPWRRLGAARWQAVVDDRLGALLGEERRARVARLWASAAGDWALAAACAVVAWVPLSRVWADLSPNRYLSGPDTEGYLAAAIAYETNAWVLYPDDRYAGYPWLVSLLSPDSDALIWTGTTLSMACIPLTAVALYWVGRQLVGRAAGVVGAVLACRQIVAIDVGKTWTSYPLVAFLDAALVALGVAVVQASPRAAAVAAVGFAGAGGLACASDPKQIPLVVAMGAVVAVVALVRRGRPLLLRLALPVVVLLPLPAGQLAMSTLPAELMSLEGLVGRTPGNVVSAELAALPHDDGFILGQPGAFQQLPETVERLRTQVHPESPEHFRDRLAHGLAAAWPDTSATWLWLGLAMPLVVLVGRRGPRRLVGPALVALVLGTGVPLGTSWYAHRWALPVYMLLPTAAAGTVGLLTGPAGVLAAGAVVLLAPRSPLHEVSGSYLRHQDRQTDSWAQREDAQLREAVAAAVAAVPPGTPVYDFLGSQPAIPFALHLPYTECRKAQRWQGCRTLSEQRPLLAVVRLQDGISAALPGGPGAVLPMDAGLPEAIGCWQYMDWLRHDAGIYRWDCPEAPSSGKVPPTVVAGDRRPGLMPPGGAAPGEPPPGEPPPGEPPPGEEHRDPGTTTGPGSP